MQASKIKVHNIYAIKDAKDKLTRFQVTAVVTRRVENHGNPRDYESTVEGHYFPILDGSKPITLSPDQILGPYLEFEGTGQAKASGGRGRSPEAG